MNAATVVVLPCEASGSPRQRRQVRTERILLFDWISSGHGELYIRKLAEALDGYDVIAALPQELVERVSDLRVGLVSLERSRPLIDERRHLSRKKRAAGRAEVEVLRSVIAASSPDRVFHLAGDRILAALVGAPKLPVPVSLLFFRPRAHYPTAFESPLSLRERAVSTAFELLLARWRRRGDAHAVATLDEYAARAWASSRGAPSYWFPEPHVLVPESIGTAPRQGAIVIGALSERKGIDHVARAVCERPSLKVVLAGRVEPGYVDTFERLLGDMRACGAWVEVRNRWYSTEEDLVRDLATGQCAVLAYRRHLGMSRVLLEAAAAGTPVVADQWGLLGYLVRRHGLGVTCQSSRPRELAAAVAAVAEDETVQARYAYNLRRFASTFTAERFKREVLAILGLRPVHPLCS
jgi:glycosyltransferase involved in cell wall biosynthesis